MTEAQLPQDTFLCLIFQRIVEDGLIGNGIQIMLNSQYKLKENEAYCIYQLSLKYGCTHRFACVMCVKMLKGMAVDKKHRLYTVYDNKRKMIMLKKKISR